MIGKALITLEFRFFHFNKWLLRIKAQARPFPLLYSLVVYAREALEARRAQHLIDEFLAVIFMEKTVTKHNRAVDKCFYVNP
jgi:hypothetical protein